jgi:hypothetical protein
MRRRLAVSSLGFAPGGPSRRRSAKGWANSPSYSFRELSNWVANARRIFCVVERAHFSERAAFESDWGLKEK